MMTIKTTPIEEREANYFALCLLMPEKFIRDEIVKIGGSIDLTEDKPLRQLAATFKVSMGMMAARLGQLGYLCIERSC
jgi:Zn-dependent peptidase ImmA (M78 family)